MDDSFELDFQGLNEIHEIELRLNIQESGEEYYCQGEVRAIVSLECARCLTELKKNLTSQTDFIVCSKEKYDKEKEIVDNEDYAFYKGSDLNVDLGDIVRQALILEMTIKPLCSEDCRGLCPKCGVNLNEKSCSCNVEQYDPRWEALKKLSTQVKKEGK
ncbi:DUF177 domain-containing protein [Candidatus Zixiibacteriota bacterium]